MLICMWFKQKDSSGGVCLELVENLSYVFTIQILGAVIFCRYNPGPEEV